MECRLSLSTKTPLLPPIVTNDIISEIKYYKQLAVAVEEKLKTLEIIIGVPRLQKNNCSSVNDTDTTKEYDTSNFNHKFDNPQQLKNIYNDAVQILSRSESTSISKNNKIMKKNKTKAYIPYKKHFMFSSSRKFESNLVHNTYSNKDLPQAGKSLSVTFPEDDSSKKRNSQVPKTLQILPITFEESKHLDNYSVKNKTTKTFRRDSYILEKPSSMFLSQDKNDVTKTEYSKSTISKQVAQCQEDNTTQIKSDLETLPNVKKTLMQFSSDAQMQKNYSSNITHQRICKSVSNSKTGSPVEIHKTQSVDCIRTIFAKECHSSTFNSHELHRQKNLSDKNKIFMKSNDNTSTLHLTEQLAKTLKGLESIISRSVIEHHEQFNRDSTKKDFNKNSGKVNEQHITQMQKNPKISEKIITTFKEIQDTHKNQMSELLKRQHQEITHMQENFKKQQILLLTQIKKAFPEVSISELSETIRVSTDHPKTAKIHLEQKQKWDPDLQVNKIIMERGDLQNTSLKLKKPLKMSSNSRACNSSIKLPTSRSNISYKIGLKNIETDNQSPTINCSHLQRSNNRSIDDTPVRATLTSHSIFSQQLFALKSQTDVSCFRNFFYSQNHIKAAIIINAYAKGFLVRRLMKTEFVIDLKNTYKEALHCMLKLHVDAPLNLSELNLHQKLQLQCDAASLDIVNLFTQSPAQRMQIIAQDREIKKIRCCKPSSNPSYSFATQRTLARKKVKESISY